MELYDNDIRPQRALLISVDTGDFDAKSSMAELYDLAESAGAEVTASVIQKLEKPISATYVGTGRLEEIAELAKTQEVDLIIADSELTPTQIRNIEQETDVRVIDRTMLILDIFALRANSKEGKLQVEIAQLKYMLPRLTGKGVQMSRLGGGIGTRGPGESKLETDKRHIRRKLEALREQLSDIERHREQLRKRREKDGVITAAIVGYTNAGKSTLMNCLTDAGVLAKDQLFATLDPTSRALKLPNGVTVMLIDTVGLVRRLPHHLVEAFKSTLEEAATADVIINVCDASSEEALLHLDVTRELLQSLGCSDTPIITVFNKCDLAPTGEFTAEVSNSVRISAKKGEGIDNLLAAIEDNLPIRIKKVDFLLPFDKGGLAADIRKNGTLISEEYTADGILLTALVDEAMYGRLREFAV
ncbi:MAG: GTPase HflX [Lachnospiraceae bacterium]|nr:GTPase HflX [Lachnospiraceae bacterium]